MAEELYFLKLNPNTAKTKLAHLLHIDEQFSYRNYINRYSQETLIFEKILNKIETDITLLSVEEFWSLFNWFHHRVEVLNPGSDYDVCQEEFCNTIRIHGMDLFYEIPSKTPVRKFHSILGDYEYQIQRDLEFQCKSEEFDNFLNYAICYSGELLLFLNTHYYKDAIDNGIQKQIDIINLKYGKLFHESALKEFEKTYEYNLETINLLPPLTEFRRSTKSGQSVSYPVEFNEIMERESDLISLANSYYHFIALKEKTENYSGIIVRLHSF